MGLEVMDSVGKGKITHKIVVSSFWKGSLCYQPDSSDASGLGFVWKGNLHQDLKSKNQLELLK